MNNEQLTLKANQAIQDSVRLGAELGNQEIVPPHLVRSILLVLENIVPETIKKIGVDPAKLGAAANKELAAMPKVQGAEDFLGNAMKKALARAAGNVLLLQSKLFPKSPQTW